MSLVGLAAQHSLLALCPLMERRTPARRASECGIAARGITRTFGGGLGRSIVAHFARKVRGANIVADKHWKSNKVMPQSAAHVRYVFVALTLRAKWATVLAPQQTIMRASANLRCEGATANLWYSYFEHLKRAPWRPCSKHGWMQMMVGRTSENYPKSGISHKKYLLAELI